MLTQLITIPIENKLINIAIANESSLAKKYFPHDQTEFYDFLQHIRSENISFDPHRAQLGIEYDEEDDIPESKYIDYLGNQVFAYRNWRYTGRNQNRMDARATGAITDGEGNTAYISDMLLEKTEDMMSDYTYVSKVDNLKYCLHHLHQESKRLGISLFSVCKAIHLHGLNVTGSIGSISALYEKGIYAMTRGGKLLMYAPMSYAAIAKNEAIILLQSSNTNRIKSLVEEFIKTVNQLNINLEEEDIAHYDETFINSMDVDRVLSVIEVVEILLSNDIPTDRLLTADINSLLNKVSLPDLLSTDIGDVLEVLNETDSSQISQVAEMLLRFTPSRVSHKSRIGELYTKFFKAYAKSMHINNNIYYDAKWQPVTVMIKHLFPKLPADFRYYSTKFYLGVNGYIVNKNPLPKQAGIEVLDIFTLEKMIDDYKNGNANVYRYETFDNKHITFGRFQELNKECM